MLVSERPFRFIWEAEWYDVPNTDYPLTPERWIEECFHPLVGTQVDCLTYNLWSSDNCVCQLESAEMLAETCDQVEDAWVWRTRENTKRLVEAGANPPELACKYAHKLGIPAIPIVRMNDAHDHIFPFDVTSFKRDHPEYLLGYAGPDWKPLWSRGEAYLGHPDPMSVDSFTWGLFDFAHEAVREHKMAIIEEMITRWDNDGIDLDFDRDPRYFREFGKRENAELITDMVRRTRALLDRAAKERGRPQYLIVRVTPHVDVSWERGLDVRTWVKEGLVDVVIPGCGSMNISQYLCDWVDLVNGSRCRLFPSNNHWKTPEETRAWAKLMYLRGADGLVLFNYGHLLHGFDANTPMPRSSTTKFDTLGTRWFSEVHPEYYRVLGELGDPRSFAYRNCRYALESFSHEDLPGWQGKNHRWYWGCDDVALPVALPPGRHRVPFGFADDLAGAMELGMRPRVTLRMKIFNHTAPDDFDVLVNEHVLPHEGRTTRAVFIMDNDTWIAYPVPGEFVKLGENELTVDVHRLNPGLSVPPELRNLEIVVDYD